MEMREIDQLLMHDSAVQLFGDAVGQWHEFGQVDATIVNLETRGWLQKVNPYLAKLPENIGWERVYKIAYKSRRVKAYGEVSAKNVLQLRLDHPDDGEGEWSEHLTYCGTFTVWWK